MKIFISHSNRQKLFVKELKKYLPEFIDLWIDEKELLIGENFGDTIDRTIEKDTDFLILIIDSNSIKSKWVYHEFELAIKRELSLNRPFVLPIVLEKEAWEEIEDSNLKSRQYIHCYEFTDASIKMASNQLINQLFAWTSQELFGTNNLKNDSNKSLDLLDKADSFIKEIAEKIRLLVYPYRQSNPLELIRLLDMLKEQDELVDLSIFEFKDLIYRILNQNHLTGIVSNGESIWVKQEHHSWKKAIHSLNKEKIAKKAIQYIESDTVVALDSGSTTLAIAKEINKGLEIGLWDNLKIVTNSIPIAEELLKYSSKIGLNDKNNILRVYMIEGRIRPNSLAVVNDDDIYKDSLSGFNETLQKLNGADVCFIGANGLYKEEGFAVHNKFEIRTKTDIINNSNKKFIVIDSSKFKIKEEKKFIDFNDNVSVITTNESSDDLLSEFTKMIKNTSLKLITTS